MGAKTARNRRDISRESSKLAVAGDPPAGFTSQKMKRITAILIVGFSLFALCALITYLDTTGLTEAARKGNLCGATGQALARFLLYGFGYASYALVICMGIWGVVLFTRRDLPAALLKVVGLVFFTMFLAAFLSHLLKGVPASIPDYGGLVGRFLDVLLSERLALGVLGTRILLMVLFLITFILATDWAFFTPLLALGRWVKQYAQRWREKTREAREKAAKARDESAKRKKEERKAAAAAAVAKAETEKRHKKDLALARLQEREERKASARAGKDSQAAPADTSSKAATPAGAVEPPKSATPPAPHARPAAGKTAPEEGEAPSPISPSDGETVQIPLPYRKKGQKYRKPNFDLLETPKPVPHSEMGQVISETSSLLETTLQSFKIEAEVVEIQRGPVITMFELELAPGIKVERIRSLEDDIAMAVKAPSVRIVAPIPGKSTVGIEVPNQIREVVRLKDLFLTRKFRDSKYAIPICLGKDAAGNALIDDLAKMPHLLVAGSTGSGKSVCLNAIIMSVLFTRTPEQAKLILVDPKMVELSYFKNIPHLMCPVVTEMKRAGTILEWATRQMDSRYNLLHMAGVRNIHSYNKLSEKELRERLGELAEEDDFQPSMPFIVIVVDELADLMMIGTREVEMNITRLAQKSRAVGIHLVLATQRPSTNVITGLIKANMPTRIAFMVASKIDSRVILDVNGAEKLLGQGDMLYMPPHTSLVYRSQGTYVSDEEVRDVTRFLRENAEPEFEPELTGAEKADFDPSAVDELYNEAVEHILETQRGSASLLQRRFSIGYTRASRLIDLMSQDGILGDYKGSQAREVLLSDDEWKLRLAEQNNKKKKKGKARR